VQETDNSKIFAILNLSRDSFSENFPRDFDEEAWFSNRLELFQTFVEKKLAYIDIGAESTRPFAIPIKPEEEIRLLKKFLKDIKFQYRASLSDSDFPKISIDSYKSQVIRALMEDPELLNMLSCINDVKALSDKSMSELLFEIQRIKDLKVLLMHSKGGVPPKLSSKDIPDDFYDSDGGLLEALKKFFSSVIEKATMKGLSRSSFILDPGLGFGKNLKQSLEILDLIPILKSEFDLPILIGSSRKSFLELWKPYQDRDITTAEYNKKALKQGADYFRVHVL
jgi:dihydropteroate synthase